MEPSIVSIKLFLISQPMVPFLLNIFFGMEKLAGSYNRLSILHQDVDAVHEPPERA